LCHCINRLLLLLLLLVLLVLLVVVIQGLLVLLHKGAYKAHQVRPTRLPRLGAEPLHHLLPQRVPLGQPQLLQRPTQVSQLLGCSCCQEQPLPAL
jgi:hypothetical protein